MNGAWELVKLVERFDSIHKKRQVNLRKVSMTCMVEHAKEELDELKESIDRGDPDIKELGDALSCIFQIAIRLGWTKDAIDRAMMDKLIERIDFGDGQQMANRMVASFTGKVNMKMVRVMYEIKCKCGLTVKLTAIQFADLDCGMMGILDCPECCRRIFPHVEMQGMTMRTYNAEGEDQGWTQWSKKKKT